MASANPSRPGLIQGGNDPRAIFEQVFSGEVLTAFETRVQLKDKQRIRVVDHGKSAQFPAIYKAEAHRHTPGQELTGQDIPSQEVIVTIDDMLVSDVFIASIDEAMSSYEVREPYSTELGHSLALAYDKNVCRTILHSARGGALFNGDQGGSTLSNAAYATDGTKLLDGIALAKQTMDEKDVPVEIMPVFAGLKPAQWYLVARTDKNLNNLYGGSGSVAHTGLTTVDDVHVIKSNAFPFGKDESTASIPSKYQGNWTNTVGMVWTPPAVASLHLMDLALDMNWDFRRRGTLIVGELAVGHGTLRTKCAVELAKA